MVNVLEEYRKILEEDSQLDSDNMDSSNYRGEDMLDSNSEVQSEKSQPVYCDPLL